MAYDPIEPEELKKLVMQGKKRPMNFAYNPGPKGADLLIINRIKAPDVLGRTAKKHGEGTKVALGTFEIDAKQIILTAEMVVPGLAKKLRKHLKTLDFSFAVVVLDPSGAEVDTDMGEDTSERAQVAKGTSADDESAPEPTDPSAVRSELAERLRALQAPVAALGPAGAPHKKAAAAVITLLKAGKLDKADATLSKIEASVAHAQSVSGGATAETDAQKSDPKELIARANSLREGLVNLDATYAQAVKRPLVEALKALKARDNATAQTHLAAAEQAATAQSDNIESAENPARLSNQQQKWDNALGPIQAKVDEAMQAKTGDLDAINRAFNYAKSQAEAGDFDSALKSAATTIKLLKEAASAPMTRVEDAVETPPENVVAYTKSRLSWINTRNNLQAELVKLKMAIDAQTKGVEGLEQIAENTSVLLDYLEELDSTLENTLEALVETPDSAARETLKREAIKVIGTYRDTLDTDFFKAVDDNGFANTNIRASALTALSGVETALAA